MSQTAFILLAAAASAALAQPGRITGTVKDDGGAPLAGALVMATRRSPVPAGTTGPGGVPLFMPIQPNAPSGAQGNFQIDGLPAGTYTLCVEKPDASILNPCLWVDQPVSVQVAQGATASGVAVVAPKGVFITMRVHDVTGLLAGNPMADDLRVGTYHGQSPFIPALVSGRDATGKTVRLAVPPGQPLNVSVSSSAYSMTDDKGNLLGPGETQIPVPGSAVPGLGGSSGAPAPVFTVHVTGKK